VAVYAHELLVVVFVDVLGRLLGVVICVDIEVDLIVFQCVMVVFVLFINYALDLFCLLSTHFRCFLSQSCPTSSLI
jgi:hypothetical protein